MTNAMHEQTELAVSADENEKMNFVGGFDVRVLNEGTSQKDYFDFLMRVFNADDMGRKDYPDMENVRYVLGQSLIHRFGKMHYESQGDQVNSNENEVIEKLMADDAPVHAILIYLVGDLSIIEKELIFERFRSAFHASIFLYSGDADTIGKVTGCIWAT